MDTEDDRAPGLGGPFSHDGLGAGGAEQTVQRRIEGVAATRGAQSAVEGRCSWTYRELMTQVEALTARIKPLAGPRLIVAVEVQRAEHAIVAALACFALDMTVMPVDPQMPPARASLMLQDARPAIRLTVDDDQLTVSADGRPDDAGLTPPGSAYLMYTSGSTGAPKGVVVSHRALLERLDGLAAVPGLKAGESMLALTSFTFDIAMAELLLPLIVGGTVVCAEPTVRSDPSELDSIAARVDVIQATPSFWRLCLVLGWQGARHARLWCGGEMLTPALATGLLPLCRQLWNVYGPTEATIWATAALVSLPEPISLGAPLPGTAVHLIDLETGALAAPGQPGELIISGAGVATGYLNRELLTAARFGPVKGVPSPSYRSGDLARHRDDGSLEFLGRIDGQVKIRGHRIEVGEIEALLEQHPAVAEAAVVLQASEDPLSTHLRAFVAGRATGRELRAWLTEHLPEAMIPQKIAVLDLLPRTTAGKVDRVALAQIGNW